MSGNVGVTREVTFRFGIENPFNRAPPLINYETAPIRTNGRRFHIGATAKF